MKYKYKVVQVGTFGAYGKVRDHPNLEGKRFMSNGWAPAQETEDLINEWANKGWEYLHPIVLPYTEDGKRYCDTTLRLVFRRETT
jgi:hypothetical protein